MSESLPELTLVREIAQAMPESAWQRLVDTACTFFEDCVAPLTETTSGIGRLIRAKFERLEAVEKVIAAQTIQEAKRGLEEHSIPLKPIQNPKTLLETIAGASSETSVELHDLWVNLLAQEISSGTVHPEIPRVLSRLTSDDARLLSSIHRETNDVMRAVRRSMRSQIPPSRISYLFRPKPTVNHGVLEELNLIRNDNGAWEITPFGESFIEAVSPPWENKSKSQEHPEPKSPESP